jgi:membrane-bound serine protease (ClpP class)
VVVGIAIMMGAFFAFIITKAVGAQRKQAVTGREGLIGAIAKVKTELSPEGYVFLKGERWRARSIDGSIIQVGVLVRVVGKQGFVLQVEPVDKEG